MTGRRPPLFGFPFIRAVRQRLDDGHSQTFRFIIMSNFERCVIATRESPLAMWQEAVERDGVTYPHRFTYLGD